jgi:L-idonate 5-dehydrogenase
MGASQALNTKSEPEALANHTRQHGRFDVFFECAGSGPALSGGLAELGPKSVCVLVGQGAEIPFSVSTLIGREIEMRGSFRFDAEYRMAVDYLERGLIEVRPLITATLPVEQFQQAFDLASDKGRSMKVQLSFV